MDERALGDGQVDGDGVDQQVIRSGVQALHGAAHGQARGLIDIDVIDFESIGRGHGPGYGAFPDADGQNFAAFGRELLAIAQAADGAIRRKDDGGGEDRPEQGATSDFVDAGDSLETLGLGLALVFGLASHQ